MTDEYARVDRYAESRSCKLYVECVAAIDLGRALPNDTSLRALMHGCTAAQLEVAFAELRTGRGTEMVADRAGFRRVRILVNGKWSRWSAEQPAPVTKIAAE